MQNGCALTDPQIASKSVQWTEAVQKRLSPPRLFRRGLWEVLSLVFLQATAVDQLYNEIGLARAILTARDAMATCTTPA